MFPVCNDNGVAAADFDRDRRECFANLCADPHELTRAIIGSTVFTVGRRASSPVIPIANAIPLMKESDERLGKGQLPVPYG